MREKNAFEPGFVETVKQFEEAKEELKYLYGRAGRFEAGQQLRVEEITKCLVTLKGMTPKAIACHQRIILGMPLMPRWLKKDWDEDIMVDEEDDDLGVVESEYGLSYLTRFLSTQLIMCQISKRSRRRSHFWRNDWQWRRY